jgi:hypothetical protein
MESRRFTSRDVFCTTQCISNVIRACTYNDDEKIFNINMLIQHQQKTYACRNYMLSISLDRQHGSPERKAYVQQNGFLLDFRMLTHVLN